MNKSNNNNINNINTLNIKDSESNWSTITNCSNSDNKSYNSNNTQENLDKLKANIMSFAESDSLIEKKNLLYTYGTSGFRDNGKNLDKVALRLAAITFIRSLHLQSPIGIIISASHNNHIDNGFKIADINGDMLSIEWEELYENVINSDDLKTDLINLIDKYVCHYNIGDGKILLGYDTRETSTSLASIIISTLDNLQCPVVNYELCTTPQLHFMTFMTQMLIKEYNNTKVVNNFNKMSIKKDNNNSNDTCIKYNNYSLNYNLSKDVYFKMFKDSGIGKFNELFEKIKTIYYNHNNNSIKYNNKLVIDFSNGVGGAPEVKDNIIKFFGEYLDITVRYKYK